MVNKRNFITLIIAILLNTGCKKEVGDQINYKTPFNRYELAVEGGVQTFQKKQFIRLSIPSLNKDDVPKPVSNALVSINDYVLKETDTAGIYAGNIDDNFRFDMPSVLKIIYNNNLYQAIDTLKPIQTGLNWDIPISAVQDGQGVLLTIPKHTFGAPESAKYFIVTPGSPLWHPGKLNEKQNFSYSYTLGSPNPLYPLVSEVQKSLVNVTDTLTVYKFSVTPAYSRYLYSVFQETDGKSIFSSSPGKIEGNLSGNAVGFFYATDVKIQKIAVRNLLK
ncbi:MAG: hypothetical protein JWQ25_2288 [Daejeonella sp.]|nr:hypothetical protein [Daejeonella sp.]